MTVAALFLQPYPLPSGAALWLVLPLLVCVALVYKAIRAREVRLIWREATVLFLEMSGGLLVLGAGLWALLRYWPR